MARIKDWMMDMEQLVGNAVECGFSTEQDILAYVNTHTTYGVIDTDFVRKAAEELLGD